MLINILGFQPANTLKNAMAFIKYLIVRGLYMLQELFLVFCKEVRYRGVHEALYQLLYGSNHWFPIG